MRNMGRKQQCGVTVALLLAIGLAACTDAPSQPAPVFLNGGLGNTATRSAAAKPIPPDSRFVIVGPSQSLGGIAEANHVSKQAIISANHLSPPYKLKIGQTVRLPVSVAASTPRHDNVAAAAPRRSRHSTVLADTRSPEREKRRGSEEIIPLDDPTPPRIAASAAAAARSGTSDQTTWVSPAPAAPSRTGATASSETAKQ